MIFPKKRGESPASSNTDRQREFKARNEKLGRKRLLGSIYITKDERDIIKPMILEKLDELRNQKEA